MSGLFASISVSSSFPFVRPNFAWSIQKFDVRDVRFLKSQLKTPLPVVRVGQATIAWFVVEVFVACVLNLTRKGGN